MAIEALGAGKHVLVEKPISIELDAAERMVAAANDAGRLLMVAHVLPFFPEFRWTREAIESFVARVTDAASPDFVPVEERIAVFDNDGTLWAEQPFYFQALFGLDLMRQAAEIDPDLANREPYATVLSQGLAGLGAIDPHALLADLRETEPVAILRSE